MRDVGKGAPAGVPPPLLLAQSRADDVAVRPTCMDAEADINSVLMLLSADAATVKLGPRLTTGPPPSAASVRLSSLVTVSSERLADWSIPTC